MLAQKLGDNLRYGTHFTMEWDCFVWMPFSPSFDIADRSKKWVPITVSPTWKWHVFRIVQHTSHPYRVALSQLYFDPLAQRGEHLRKHNLLIPDWIVTVSLHTGMTLSQYRRWWCVWKMLDLPTDQQRILVHKDWPSLSADHQRHAWDLPWWKSSS